MEGADGIGIFWQARPMDDQPRQCRLLSLFRRQSPERLDTVKDDTMREMESGVVCAGLTLILSQRYQEG